MHRAMALRQAFDASFAELPTAAREPQDDFVVLGMGEARCAVAMRQLGGLHADLEILSCPSEHPEFLGLAVLRGLLLPVYDLALLISEPHGISPRWFALNPSRDFAVAVERMETSFRARAVARGDTATGRVLTHAGQVIRLVDLLSLETQLRQRANEFHSTMERL